MCLCMSEQKHKSINTKEKHPDVMEIQNLFEPSYAYCVAKTGAETNMNKMYKIYIFCGMVGAITKCYKWGRTAHSVPSLKVFQVSLQIMQHNKGYRHPLNTVLPRVH